MNKIRFIKTAKLNIRFYSREELSKKIKHFILFDIKNKMKV